MSKFFERDWFRGLIMALIIIGLLALAFGAYQFVDASGKISRNYAYQTRNEGLPEGPLSEAEARVLMSSDLQYRNLLIQRDNSLIFAGAGMAILAVGWIVYDFGRARQRKANASQQSIA